MDHRCFESFLKQEGLAKAGFPGCCVCDGATRGKFGLLFLSLCLFLPPPVSVGPLYPGCLRACSPHSSSSWLPLGMSSMMSTGSPTVPRHTVPGHAYAEAASWPGSLPAACAGAGGWLWAAAGMGWPIEKAGPPPPIHPAPSEARHLHWWGWREGVTSGRAHGLGNHLNGHSDLVFPEPLEDLPEVTRPPFLQSVNSSRGLTQSSQWGRGRRAEVLSPSPSPSSRNCPSDPTGKVPKLSSSLGNLQPGRVPGAVSRPRWFLLCPANTTLTSRSGPATLA